MLKLFLLLVVLCFFNICLSQDSLPEVVTSLGKVRGHWKLTRTGRKYAAFEGIPFAKPPVGDLRFEEPQPLSPWIGIWEAKAPRGCLQTGKFAEGLDIGASEDCLYLNVYVPAEFLNNSKKLDVIVAIHGGGFMVGFPHMTRSEFVMDNDIILVSNTYRLGLFGFLSTEDDEIPGNNGLKDQALALRWVKDNIPSFGGNPDSITITGVSAGGASVHFHYFSPWSKGLFTRGISHSGTALTPWALVENPLEDAKKLAVLVGCPDHPTKELKQCLKQRPADTLAKLSMFFYGYDHLPIAPFAPVVEKGSSRPFLDEDPFLLLKEGKVLDVPWVVSHTSEEGWLPAGYYLADLERINKDWEIAVPYLLDCNRTIPESRRQTIARDVLDHYLGPEEKINENNFRKFTQIFTDRLFAIAGETSARMQAKVTKSPIYYYVFDYREGENKAIYFYTHSPKENGVGHADDGIYFYGMLVMTPFSEKDEKLIKTCHNMLTSYASTGIPSFDGTDSWQPIKSSEFTYLHISGPDNIKLETVEKLTPSDFWRKLGFLEHYNLITKDEL